MPAPLQAPAQPFVLYPPGGETVIVCDTPALTVLVWPEVIPDPSSVKPNDERLAPAGTITVTASVVGATYTTVGSWTVAATVTLLKEPW